MDKSEWIFCPVCGNKTRLRIRGEIELRNFPLYCPKCSQEILINIQKMNTSVVEEPDAKARRRRADNTQIWNAVIGPFFDN